ncbi:alpha/beta hydrolase [Bacterioplanes sanyensis]|uniref:Alpha/beta hydrolase n=1 Tax=Bacterioplanes sanyensis TaxID=1249553 RepID=A0A222FIM2_9GAMM|nr:alpha/beta fold hydrolase [Bacterioplanes sanyensis]ASP38502.1 alpha/beta hydrolase [Bacterioplanes sanyensis]
MNAMTLLRLRNAVLGRLMPEKTAVTFANYFLTPRLPAIKPWEQDVEQRGKRSFFGKDNQYSALHWSTDENRTGQTVLLVHGWESRATHMSQLIEPLLALGLDVVAIDGPAHGQSAGTTSNPVAFAHAITAAERSFGPFVAIVGHSMGGAAVAIAGEFSVHPQSYVLLAAPASLLQVLQSYASFVGLPSRCRREFISAVESAVGVPASRIHTGQLLALCKKPTLIIHSSDDVEVPVMAAQHIQQSLPDAEVWHPSGLGHRRLLKDAQVAERVAQFIADNTSSIQQRRYG